MNEFIAYCRSFYGPRGVYDMGASDIQIAMAIGVLIGRDEDSVCGDSVDRERVRDILIEKFSLKFPDPKPVPA